MSSKAASQLASLPGALPTTDIPKDLDIEKVLDFLPPQLEDLSHTHLCGDALWRDTFALTGTLRTFHSAPTIETAWRETCSRLNATSFEIDPQSAIRIPVGTSCSWIDVAFTFETHSIPATRNSGLLSIVRDNEGQFKIWVVRTILEQLQGDNDVDKLQTCPTNGFTANGYHGTINGAPSPTLPSHLDVVIIGGGQAGLSVAGRLKILGISYVVLEKNQEVGDNWKLRYGSARLHTIRQYSHLPFDRTFPAHYQEFLTKDDLARGYRDWAHKYDICVWTSTHLLSGSWDEDAKIWTLSINRDGKVCRLTTTHVILAIGAGGQTPMMPVYPNRVEFRGTVLHSAEYTDSLAWEGKHDVVVGTANTAHDVAEDMLKANLASVTMIQRSPTYVLPYEYYQRVQDMLYNDDFETEYADRMSFSNPLVVGRLLALQGLHSAARQEPERFDALEKAGFKLDRFGDITDYIYNRMGGHYMDVGASAKISEGQIRMKSDSLPVSYAREGFVFADDSTLPADLVVFATGFKRSVKPIVEGFFGPKIAHLADDFWGVDEEGELVGAFKPNAHPNLWYHGGTLGHARYYSRFIALQIKAALNRTPLAVYRETPK